jgi:lon-related putative ATP-dependent protease
MVEEIPYDRCRNFCSELSFDCRTTAELTPLKEIIGQDRAVKALRFGLKIKDKGFNVYVSGMPGTGKRTAIVDFIKELAKDLPVPSDWCYVNNFKDPNRPRALRLPPGRGAEFKKDIEHMIDQIIAALKDAFESDEYTEKRTALMKDIEKERGEQGQKINEMAKEAGFQLQQSPIGLVLVPIINGEPLSEEDFSKLPAAVQKEIVRRRQDVQQEMEKEFRPFRDIERKAEERVKELNTEVASFAMDPFIRSTKEDFKGCTGVIEYLDEVKADILEDLPRLLQFASGQQPQQQQMLPFPMPTIDPTREYKVNLLVDNSGMEGAPVEIELNPSYYRLFGAIEKEARFGALVTDYSMILEGAAHRANGGFLVLHVEGLFRDPMVWESLKQTLSNQTLEVEEPAARFGYMVTKSLRPEPMPFDAKVIVIGDPFVYNILYTRDKDFKELFKVRADFDMVMDRNETNIQQYASFVCGLSKKEELLHLDRSGMAALIEYSSRMVSDQNKLSTQFSEIADIVREANFYAKEDGSEVIRKEHINKQMEERIYRSNMMSEKIQEMIEKGVILIDTEGAKPGQVNGLAVYSAGDYAFGKPSRITATVAVGKDGIIDIEREAEMGGPTHTKGVIILGGYLNDMYARKKPLSLTARLAFEQSYSGVDGDSASSTELYALLSALSGMPIDQDLAVTGSVNQKGEVQAIGGVNQKVEGFFEVCKAMGLNGKQGCMVPASNVQNLMLKDEVIEAIKEGKFHIYPIRTIGEGIEVLTGIPVGQRDEEGNFPEGTINHLVQKRLDDMAKGIKNIKMEEMAEMLQGKDE